MPKLTNEGGMNYSNAEAAVALAALENRRGEILHIAKETARAVAKSIEHNKNCKGKNCKAFMVAVDPNMLQCLLAVIPLAIHVAKDDGHEAMQQQLALHIRMN